MSTFPDLWTDDLASVADTSGACQAGLWSDSGFKKSSLRTTSLTASCTAGQQEPSSDHQRLSAFPKLTGLLLIGQVIISILSKFPSFMESMKRFGPDPKGTRLRGSLLIAPKIVTNTMRPSWTFSSSYARKGWADFSFFSSSIFFFQHRGKMTQQIATTHFCKSQVSISFFICSLSKLFQCCRRGTLSRRNIGQHRGFASLIHQTLCRNFLLLESEEAK